WSSNTSTRDGEGPGTSAAETWMVRSPYCRSPDPPEPGVSAASTTPAQPGGRAASHGCPTRRESGVSSRAARARLAPTMSPLASMMHSARGRASATAAQEAAGGGSGDESGSGGGTMIRADVRSRLTANDLHLVLLLLSRGSAGARQRL